MHEKRDRGDDNIYKQEIVFRAKKNGLIDALGILARNIYRKSFFAED